MPFTALDPPRVFPRTQISAVCAWPMGFVGKNQAKRSLPSSLPKPRGILTMRLLSLPPASRSNTRFAGSADRRLASTHPADPAPTMT